MGTIISDDNGQGKEIICKHDYSAGTGIVNSIINGIDKSINYINTIKVDRLEH